MRDMPVGSPALVTTAPSLLARVRQRPEFDLNRAMFQAAPVYAWAWWILLVLRGALTAVISLSIGWLISSVQRDVSLAWPLTVTGIVFTLLLVLQPIHQAISSNLGSRVAAWLYDELITTTTGPEGIGHLERPELTNDLTMARDFDLGMLGPPLEISMDFIAGGLLDLIIGIAAAAVLAAYAWWAPLVLLVAWGCTHWLLRESGVWKDRNNDDVRTAQRHAEYSYRLAVDAAPAKELRLFGLAGWVIDRFVTSRRRLYELQYEATRLREKPLVWCLVIALAANVLVFYSLADATVDGRISTAEAVVFLQAAAGVAAIAFGGLNWAVDGAAAPVAAVRRLRTKMPPAGELSPSPSGTASTTVGSTAPTIRLRGLGFSYPMEGGDGVRVLDGVDVEIPGGSSMAIVGVNGAGKTTLAKLLCRLYDPQEGAIEIDGVDLRDLDVQQWRKRVTAVFQDFVKFELPLRTNVSPMGVPDAVVLAALTQAGAGELATLDTPLAKGYDGGTDLSGGQWQRVALARALAAVASGARVVLLDEPTAQLDVRGEAEIFERVLAATKECTTILISHRFSTVKLADRICVIEHGKVVEVGSHDELIAYGGRYKTMFELQASRFAETDDEGEEVVFDAL
jgi:ABC-type multidrug transport system fused ATPase/permease subunit